MPTTSLMPLPKQRYTTALGTPLVGGKVYTYAAGTTNPKATYTDAAGTTPQPNPIPLNLRGEPDNPIYWSGNYRVDVRDALGNLVYSVDNYNTDPAGVWGIFTTLLASAGSALVGFIAAGVGAVKRTLQDKGRDTVDVRDYGAGVDKSQAQNKTALQKAIAAVDLAGGGVIEVKNGIDYGFDTRTLSTYPDFTGCTSDIMVVDQGKGTADGVNKAGAQTRVFCYTKQTVPPGQHDGNGFWNSGDWHPYFWVNNTGDIKPVGDPARAATDNRRASVFFGSDGAATWRVGQGTLAGAGYTDEELSNFVIEMFATDGSTLIDNAPLTIERKTGNWSICGGTNAPQAAIHVKNASLGYPQAMFESLTTLAQILLRTSNGAGDDVAFKNTAGDFAISITSLGNALEILKANRYVGIGTSPSYKLDVHDSKASGFVLNVKNENTTNGNVGILDSASAAGVGWNFLRMFSSSQTEQAFYMRGDGNAAADGAWASGGADYAEYFEWADGNPSNEDRRGVAVTLDTAATAALGRPVIKAAAAGDDLIGVVSATPSVVGDSAAMEWAGKYARDAFGSYVLDADGARVLNPKFDSEVEYVSREFRKEWACIGLMGKLRVRVGQPTGDRWIKMRTVSPTVEEWLVR